MQIFAVAGKGGFIERAESEMVGVAENNLYIRCLNLECFISLR